MRAGGQSRQGGQGRQPPRRLGCSRRGTPGTGRSPGGRRSRRPPRGDPPSPGGPGRAEGAGTQPPLNQSASRAAKTRRNRGSGHAPSPPGAGRKARRRADSTWGGRGALLPCWGGGWGGRRDRPPPGLAPSLRCSTGHRTLPPAPPSFPGVAPPGAQLHARPGRLPRDSAGGCREVANPIFTNF